MTDGHVHRAPSADGTGIAARVVGSGPPLVLVHGGAGNGDLSWRALLPILRARFTCYPMSLRGRGLSDDAPDHTRERLVEDVACFVESIGGPVGLFGHSSGAALAIDAAAQASPVRALALYEPTLFDWGPRNASRDAAAFAGIGAAMERGDSIEAVRIFLSDVALALDEELAAVSASGLVGGFADCLGIDMLEASASGPPRLRDPAALERIAIPVLVMVGSRSDAFYGGVARTLVDRLSDATLREIPGVAHLAPQVEPEPVARELAAFFAEAPLR